MSLDKALQTAVASIPECVAAGFVDLSTGMLLSAKTVDSHPAEVLEVVAAATADLFQGTNVSLIESMFKKARGVENDNHHYFQEIIINSDNLLHVFLRSKSNEEHVATFVCRKSANRYGLTKSRSSMPSIEAAI